MNAMKQCSVLIMLFSYAMCELELKHVQVLFRHGDRSPTFMYPKDQNQANKWPRGLGQLTEIGIREQFNLGLWLRNRYNSLIGPILNNSDIHVRSTDVDRTLMSAESNLAGFVFKEAYQIVSGLPWRPISVHTVREKTDYLLEFNICPRYVKERAAAYSLDFFKKRLGPYESMLQYIKEQTGIKDLTFQNIWEVYDVLFCERVHNMTVNDWVTKDIWTNLTNVNIINWEIMFYKHLDKLAAGLLLHQIIDRMKNVTTKDPWNQDGFKYVVYSGHDTDVAPIAKLLGFYRNIQPPYASCVIFELYEEKGNSGQWSVKVLYKNSTDSDTAYGHIVPGCPGEICPLSRFIEVTKHNTLTRAQFMRECGLDSDIFFYVGLGFGVVCVLVVGCVLMMVLLKRHSGRTVTRYTRVDEDKSIN